MRPVPRSFNAGGDGVVAGVGMSVVSVAESAERSVVNVGDVVTACKRLAINKQ